jgi:hypothetical protein
LYATSNADPNGDSNKYSNGNSYWITNGDSNKYSNGNSYWIANSYAYQHPN